MDRNVDSVELVDVVQRLLISIGLLVPARSVVESLKSARLRQLVEVLDEFRGEALAGI